METKMRVLQRVPRIIQKGMVALLLLALPMPVQAACSGSGLSFTCAAGSTIADVQSAIDNGADGATITFAAGSYTWANWAQFSNSKGVTLICASQGACVVNFSGTVLGISSFSGTNTHFYRISGFTFQNNPASTFIIWFDGNGVTNGPTRAV